MSDVVRILDGTIAVRERGAGPPIVLIHGNSCSSRSFEHQLAGELAEDFRVIAFDLPGHGDSAPAKAPDRTYTLPGYATTIACVATALGVQRAVFAGWSLGGHALLEAAAQLGDAAGFLVFGAPPVTSFAEFSAATFPHPAVAAGFVADPTPEQQRELAALFVRPGTSAPAVFVEDLARTDGRARAALGASAARGELTDERSIVASLGQPLAILHGASDQIIRRDYLDSVTMPTLWRGAIQEIADAGHAPHWEQPAAFDALVAAFARECLGG